MVADGYHNFFEPLTGQAIAALLDGVGATAGITLLDVACGPGYVAAEAKQRGCAVTAVDFSQVMIAKARHTFPNIKFQESDAEQLEFTSESFHAYTMNFGILHLEQPEKALQEASRVLLPGGRAGFTVWCTPDLARGFGCVLDAITKHGDASLKLPEGPPFFRFSDLTEFERVLRDCSFARVTFERLDMEWELPNPEALFDAFLLGTPRTGGLLRAQPADRLALIKEKVLENASIFAVNGKLRVPMPAWLAIASK